MSHLPIDKSKNPQSLRLFQSYFLEDFTHISPAAILGMWLPIVVLLLAYAVLILAGPTFPVNISYGFFYLVLVVRLKSPQWVARCVRVS